MPEVLSHFKQFRKLPVMENHPPTKPPIVIA
jgi:hypothetical protein